MIIRRFEDKDAVRVSRLIEECFNTLNPGGHTEEGIRLQVEGNQPDQLIERAKTVKYYVATLDDTIAGVCGYGDGRVQTLFVDIKHQGRGVGTALLTHVLANAKRDGLTQIATWSTISAETWYAALGFKKERELYFPEGAKDITLIEMNKDLH